MNRAVGGTPGGMGRFLAGLALIAVGFYLLLNQVTVATSPWMLFGVNAFGLSLLPFLVGVGFLFFDGRSIVGWALLAIGAGIIVAGILMSMNIYFRPTSLFNTLLMLAMLAGGIGLLASALRAHGSDEPGDG